MFPQQPQMNPQAFLNSFKAFVDDFRQNNAGVNPQQMVQNLLNQGKMTQGQFNQLRAMANQIMGTRN